MVVPRALNRSTQFDDAVAGIERQFYPDVVRIRYSLEDDWSGEPAVYFRITLADAAATRDRLWPVANGIEMAIERQIESLGEWGVLPYYNYRSQSEQAHLNDPAWA